MEYNNNKKQSKPKLIIVDAPTSIEDIEMIDNNSFTVVSTINDLDEDKLVRYNAILAALKSKGLKFNYNNDARDPLAQLTFKRFEIFSDIFLPFKNFNKEGLVSADDGEEITPTLAEPSIKAHKLAAKYKYKKEFDEEGSLKYNSLSETIKKFSARDVHLLLGPKCAMKIKFIIINTSDGVERTEDIDFKTTAGAGFPIKLANLLEIPVFNIGKAGRLEDLEEYVKNNI